MNITISEFIPLALLIFIVYGCVYSIVNRICTCKELCTKFKACSGIDWEYTDKNSK